MGGGASVLVIKGADGVNIGDDMKIKKKDKFLLIKSKGGSLKRVNRETGDKIAIHELCVRIDDIVTIATKLDDNDCLMTLRNGIEYVMDEVDNPDEIFDIVKKKMMQNEDDEAKPGLKFKDFGRGYTWAESKRLARREGGRLLTMDEAKQLLEEQGCLCDGEDAWAAVINPELDDGKDWIQVGNSCHEPGTAHVEGFGYPGWGDNDEDEESYHRFVMYWDYD